MFVMHGASGNMEDCCDLHNDSDNHLSERFRSLQLSPTEKAKSLSLKQFTRATRYAKVALVNPDIKGLFMS